MRKTDGADLLVPVALEVAGVVAPAGKEDFECWSWRRSRNGEVLEEREDGLELLVNEVGEGEDETLREIGCKICTTGRREYATHLREHGGLCGRKTSNECPQQVRQDRTDCSACLPNEVDDEVTDEETSCLRLGRLEELGDLCEDKLETRLAGSAPPGGRSVSLGELSKQND